MIRFEEGEFPPAKAFWSITIYNASYDGKAGFLVDNPIDRYLFIVPAGRLKSREEYDRAELLFCVRPDEQDSRVSGYERALVAEPACPRH